MNVTIIEVIKGMLAPGIMISACGLLLLGMNNKYSLVVINSEFRDLDKEQSNRRDCILAQLPLLIERMKLIRNTVWLYTVGIAMFILSIFILGIYSFVEYYQSLNIVAFVIFIAALIAVVTGVLYAAKEVRLGYKIVRIETNNILYIEE